MSVKIAAFTLENIKRIKALTYEPTATGLTVIGGGNAQGKTTILDALAWALGGGRMAPSNPHRKGSIKPPEIDVTLTNGIHVERRGKKSTLRVSDPDGKRAGQSLLDAFIGEFALNLPKFLTANAREKAQTLLQILGIGDELARLDMEYDRLYQQRHTLGQTTTQKVKYADELSEFADAPPEPVSVSELLAGHKTILANNAENERKRQTVERLETAAVRAKAERDLLREQLAIAEDNLTHAQADLATAQKSAEDLRDESTEAIEVDLHRIEEINAQVAANAEKQRAEDEANELRAQYDALTGQVEQVRTDRLALLDGADLPLPGLTIEDAELRFHGQPWDGMSGVEQLRVATAIVRQLKPDCGFVFLDHLESFDLDTLRAFGKWAEAEDLQILGTRVSTGEECSLIIEDGLPQGQSYADVVSGITAKAVDSGELMEW